MKKLFRKIHLWLSVPFGIFITLICFSGAMLVFEKEITEWCRPDLYFVKEVKEKPLPLDSLMEKVAATLPDSVTVTGVTISPDVERAWQVSLSKPRRASMYIDQYTGEVKGRSERLPFYDTMFHLHRWLMGDSNGIGKLLVGISTLMLVIILITGILMWLTNRHKPLKKSLTISFTKGWPRFWHDLHVAGGIYATIFLLALALTGLTWSFSWYRTGFYAMFGVEASAGGHGGGHGGGGRDGGAHGGRPDGKGRDRAHGESRGDEQEDGRGKRGGHDGRRFHEVDGKHADTPANEQGVERKERPHVEKAEEHAERPERKAANDEMADNTERHEEHRPEAGNSDELSAGENGERRGRGEGGERRGRHGREGREGAGERWHHHSQDSTGRYAGHHRPDSIGGHHENRDLAATEHKEHGPKDGGERKGRGGDRYGRQGKLEKGNGNGRRGGSARKPEMRIDTADIVLHKDTAAIMEVPEVSQYAHWQKIYESLAKANPGYRQITVSDGTASVVPAGRMSLRAGDSIEFDPQSGNITGEKPYKEQDKSAKVRGGVYMLHVGSWGGLLTRIITFLAALLGATLPLTGYYLWIRRLLNKNHHHHHH